MEPFGLDSPRFKGRIVLRDLVGDVGEVPGEEVLDPLDTLHALVSLLGVHLDTNASRQGGKLA